VPVQNRPAPAGRPMVTAGTAVGLTVAAILTAVLHGLALGTPAPSSAERLLTLRGWLLATGGWDALPGGWRLGWDGGDVAALPTALVAVVTSPGGDAEAAVGPAVVAGRRAALVAAVLGVLLLGMLARRLGLSPQVSVASAVLAGCLPLAVELHRPATPITVATPLLVAAALVAGTAAVSRRRVRALRALMIGLIALAGLVAPIALVPVGLLVAVLVATGDVGVDWTPGRRAATAGVATLVAVAVLTAVWVTAALAVPGEPGSGSLTSLSGAGAALTVVAGMAATLAGLAVRWMRPAAVLVLALLTLGMLGAPLVGQVAGDLVVLALPAFALLIPSMAATAVAELRRFATDRRRMAMLAASLGVAAVGLAVLATPDLLTITAQRPDSQTNRAVAWIRTELALDTDVIADDGTYVRLREAGRRATWMRELGERPVRGRADRPAVVVGRAATVRAELDRRSGRSGDGRARSVLLAGFGSGRTRVEVWWPDPPASLSPTDISEGTPSAVLERRRIGKSLAGNRNVAMPDDARAAMTRGEVDARVAAALAALSVGRQVRVSGFESADGEEADAPATPARTVLISTIDDQPAVNPGGNLLGEPPAVDQLRDWFDAQGAAYRPLSVAPRATEDGTLLLAVHFPAPAPPGAVRSGG
jgi:hypothetical protein